MKTDEVPQELVDMLDLAAGKLHSEMGVVRRTLAEILTRYESIRFGEASRDFLLRTLHDVYCDDEEGDGRVCVLPPGHTTAHDYQVKCPDCGWRLGR